MAKVKFSALISEMRNKLNGSVFSRNRGGAYLRTKVTPVNPKTQAQVLARARLASFSQAWKGLTEPQRKAWHAAVDQWKTTDIFGDLKTPSGNVLFTRLNVNIALAGGSQIDTPPLPVGAGAVESLAVTAKVGVNEMEIDFSPAAVPVDHTMIVESTPMLSPGINNANSQFRIIGTLPAATATGEDVIAEQTAKFGALIEGQKVVIRAKFINIKTGEVSQSLTASTIVAA